MITLRVAGGMQSELHPGPDDIYLGPHEVDEGQVVHEYTTIVFALWLLWHGRHAEIHEMCGPWFEVELSA